MLKAIAEYAKHDRAEFVRVVQEAQSSQQTAEVKKQRIRLATAKQRVSELEVLLCKIYEDNILGKLSDISGQTAFTLLKIWNTVSANTVLPQRA